MKSRDRLVTKVRSIPATEEKAEYSAELQGQGSVESRQPRKERSDGQKPKVNCPRASEKGIWATVNSNLIGALEGLKGTVENKIE